MSGAADDLAEFVRAALLAGQPRAAIRAALADAGWPPEQADRAMAAYAETAFPVPVPRPRPRVSARDAFLYLTLFTTLGITAWHVGSLLFTLIDIMLPDPISNGRGAWRQRELRWALSALAVAAPLFLFLTWKMNKEIESSVVARLSGIRSWLGYMTLFVAAVTIIGDLIALIYSFLNGDLTLSVALKMLVVGVIAGAIFGYYLADLRDTTART